MVTVVTLNAQGQWTHRLEIPEGHAIPDGYVLYVDQPAVPDPIKDFEQAMVAARSAMAGILDALPLADRMKIQTLRVQVEAALDKGQVDLALYIVTNASVDAHLLPVRDQILALFPQA